MAERRSWICDICRTVIEQAERQPVCVPLPREVGEPPLLVDLCDGCAEVEGAQLVATLDTMLVESPRATIQATLTGLGLGSPVINFLRRTGKVVNQDGTPQGGEEGADTVEAPDAKTLRNGGPRGDQHEEGSRGGEEGEGQETTEPCEATEAVRD